jgi:lipopolysaccharide/colanic/teichoic acid biosynthesis glycosyltransferase
VTRVTRRRPPRVDRTKRLVDLVIATPVAIVLLPVAGIVAVAVRIGVGTPVMFHQPRAGRGGRPITVHKFRTMTDAIGDDGGLLPDERRLTRVGRWLRRTSLDEIPQLVDILRGDMSIVGPRPLPLAYVDRYSERQRRRLEVRPGLTGWAQVNGRNELDWPKRLELDVWYVDNRSIRLDLHILARSVAVVLRGSGVSATDHVTMHEFTGTADETSRGAGPATAPEDPGGPVTPT